VSAAPFGDLGDGLGPDLRGGRARPWVVVLGTVLLVAGTAALAWSWVYYQGVELLPLRTIRIEGTIRNLRPEDLEQAVGAQLREGFFRVDARAVQDAAGGLPWVHSVTVRRVWPDVLLLWVEERVPFARWGADGLVTEAGVVFRPRPGEIPQGLPWLEGDDDSAVEVTEQYRRMQRQVEPLGLRIAALRLSRRGGWVVEFEDGMTLQLGAQQREERMAQFVRVFPVLRADGLQAPTPRHPESLDLRYGGGMAVRWRSGPAPEAGAPQAGGRAG
jgi:cell division protein FtsQ